MDFGRQFAGVALVLFLLGAALWWLRRRGYTTPARGGSCARRLEAVERLALGPQHSLYLVRMGRTLAVVSCSPGGCSLLERLPVEPPATGGRQ